ncbi:MAG: hypothetical protein V4560_05340 [Bacteroidota bacterium]
MGCDVGISSEQTPETTLDWIDNGFTGGGGDDFYVGPSSSNPQNDIGGGGDNLNNIPPYGGGPVWITKYVQDPNPPGCYIPGGPISTIDTDPCPTTPIGHWETYQLNVPDISPKITDPCIEKNKIKTLLSTSFIKNKNDSLAVTTSLNEQGADIKLKNWLSPATGYMNTGISTSTSSIEWTPNFTWDATHGYSVGITHFHPGGSGPSPTDIYKMLLNLRNSNLMNDNSGGPGAALQYYKDNATLTVVTHDAKYVVTVKDWSGLYKYFSDYLIAHPYDPSPLYAMNVAFAQGGTTTTDAPAFELLKMFGPYINLYKATDADPTNFLPMGLTANTNDITTLNCNP